MTELLAQSFQWLVKGILLIVVPGAIPLAFLLLTRKLWRKRHPKPRETK